MSELQIINNLVWPAHDTQCRAVVFEETATIDRLLLHVTNFDACVQAGGNCGVWPMELGKKFGTVYTFEPDHDNFVCLAHNCSYQSNIVAIQAALGQPGEAPIQLEGDRSNCGGYQVAPGGSIPVLTIDSLNLPSCGLIALDIEGYEAKALQGAQETLHRCRPVILLEMKGIGAKYGRPDDELHFWLTEGFGYRMIEKLLRDRIYVPA
jgi:FkbM family methyltransferase